MRKQNATQDQEILVLNQENITQSQRIPMQNQESSAQQSPIEAVLRKGLQEQASQYYVTAMHDRHLQNALESMRQNKAKYTQKKHVRLKKAMAAGIAAAVLALGTISIAAGGIKSIVAHSFNIPDYKSYQDMDTAAAEAGVQFYAPEQFSNGYCFMGIFMVEDELKGDESQVMDSFTSLSVRYKKGSDMITFEVWPRPMLLADSKNLYADIRTKNGVIYYYKEMHNKWVPVEYQPTYEEQQAVAEGRLNIGYGAREMYETDSKSIIWEKNGQRYELFCMENDISKEELYEMAYEIK